MSRTSYTN